MVRTVKQEFRSACNGAEFPDYKSVMIDGIVIQNIIFLKLSRIIYKIVVYRIISNFDIRISNSIFKINRLPVSCSWIYFICHSHLASPPCKFLKIA